MLGLCYRNGYGVEADTARASSFFSRAATLGNSDAMEEMLKEMPENSYESVYLKNDIDIPEEMPSIEPYIPNNKQELGGLYSGYLVTYDWSGQNVLSETPITVNFLNPADSVECVWYIGNDTVQTKAKLSKNGELEFGKEEVRRYDRYSSSYSAVYRFEKAEISYIDNSLTGELRLYSIDEQEPEKPMYICLKKDGASEEHGEDDNKIYSYPNPYTDAVTLKFELATDVPSAKICLYSQSGVNKQNFSLGSLAAGEHSYTFVPNPYENSYIVHVVAGNGVYQTIIFKKQ